MTLSPSESAVKGANTPEVGERGALASRFTAGLFWSLRAVLSTQNSPGFLDPTADSSQQSPCERYQADQRSSLVSAQTGSWVRVTKRGRKANSPPPGSSPLPHRQRLGAGGRRVLPWAPFLCPGLGHGAVGLWGCRPFGFTFSLHLIDKEQSSEKFFFLKNLEGGEMPVRGRQRGCTGSTVFHILELELSRRSEFCLQICPVYQLTPHGPNSSVEKQLVFISWF